MSYLLGREDLAGMPDDDHRAMDSSRYYHGEVDDCGKMLTEDDPEVLDGDESTATVETTKTKGNQSDGDNVTTCSHRSTPTSTTQESSRSFHDQGSLFRSIEQQQAESFTFSLTSESTSNVGSFANWTSSDDGSPSLRDHEDLEASYPTPAADGMTTSNESENDDPQEKQLERSPGSPPDVASYGDYEWSLWEEGSQYPSATQGCKIREDDGDKGIPEEKEVVSHLDATPRDTSCEEYEWSVLEEGSNLQTSGHSKIREEAISLDSSQVSKPHEKMRTTPLVEHRRPVQERLTKHPAAEEPPLARYGEDHEDDGLGQNILRRTPASPDENGHISQGGLAVASLVIEESLGGDDPQQAEAISVVKMSDKTSRYYALGMFALMLVLVAGILLGTVVLPSIRGKQDSEEGLHGGPDGLQESGVTFAPTTYRESLGIQEQIAVSVGSSKLNDASTPHYKALQWLLYEDPLQLPRSATNLIQRYALALFYFQTSEHGPWRSCNPPKLENETHSCDFLRLMWIFPELEFDVVPSNRWLSRVHECDWAGIICEEGDIVKEIILEANNLSGSLPEELGLFPRLLSFSFVNNEISGSLPAPLAVELQGKVTQIQLHYNKISGSIPPEWMQFQALERLNLASNQLTGSLPTEIGMLGASRRGDLLMGLFLFDNPGITGTIPTEVGNLDALSFLRVSKTSLEGPLPSELGRLSELKEFWGHKTKLSGPIPSEVARIGALRHLRLQHTNVNGTIPEEIYELPGLERLDLWQSKVGGTISTKIGQLANSLSVLRLQNNSLLSGELPTELGLLTNLKTLHLQHTRLEGSIPEGLCDRVLDRGQQFNGSDAATVTNLHISADCLVSTHPGVWPFVSCESGCCSVCCDGKTGACADMLT
ncbi:leucine Rich Repeat [Seminavis robusta]|uniref:Leucine Rich Repeat n=1 Tax=Seminavis robusta TaxID=568900 RepID=A0A9N8HB83_9STRA|nr:leucine Rich Repeat [Seminavis robusta]|eukprot:Sro251_g099420.1 leucine Rich Repeat (883) ;mRNA; r:75654-78659